MINQLDSIVFRVGTQEDKDAISEFALSLSEDPITSRMKWLEIIKGNHVYPLLAFYKENIVGKIQAKINSEYGWIESARVSSEFRKLGIANTLVDDAMNWLVAKGVKFIRTIIDSDNLSARRIIEKHDFTLKFLAINPNYRIVESDRNPKNTADFALILDEEFFEEFNVEVEKNFAGNIMVDGGYHTFTKHLFASLIDEKRVYADQMKSTMIITSKQNLPHEYHGFIVSNHLEGYTRGANALKAFGARELATTAICHAPSKRNAIIGLSRASFSWSQPHSIIIYQKDV